MAVNQDTEVRELIKIEKNLEEIKNRTGNTRRAFFYGIFQGAGAVIGSILMIILLGWGLSVLGVIPGFSDIASFLRAQVLIWQQR